MKVPFGFIVVLILRIDIDEYIFRLFVSYVILTTKIRSHIFSLLFYPMCFDIRYSNSEGVVCIVVLRGLGHVLTLK